MPATAPHLTLNDQVCFAVYSTAHAFNRVYKPLLDALGVTYPQYVTLLVLWEQDGIVVKELGERLFLDSATLTPLLKRLEAAGYVRRERDAVDQRQVRITLTPAGRALQEKAASIPFSILCASGQSVDALVALKTELAALRDHLHAASDNPDGYQRGESAPTDAPVCI